MFQRVRGHAVIINNKYFVHSDERQGCDNDVADLQELFDAIHFKVHLHENKIAQVISVFCQSLFFKDAHCQKHAEALLCCAGHLPNSWLLVLCNLS